MKNFLAYLKVLLIDQYRPRKDGSKMMRYAIIILAVCFIPILALMFVGMLSVGNIIAQLDLMTEAATLIITIGQIIVIVFGLIMMLNTLYFSKDSEFALPLPLKPMTIYAAKLTSVYIFELLTSFIITIAVLLPLGIGASIGAGYYITLLFAFIFIPILPLLLASLVAIPLMYVVNFFRNKGFLSTIAFVLMFVVLFGGYYLLVMQFTSTGDIGDSYELEQIIVQIVEQIKTAAAYIFPNYWLASLMTAATFGIFALNLLFEVGICAVLLVITILISNLVYNSSISRSLEMPKSTGKSKGTFSNTSQMRAIITKDIKHILRFPSLGFYCLTQVVMAPLLMFVMLISMKPLIEEIGKGEIAVLLSSFGDGVILVLVIILLFFVISLNYTAASAISRESDSYYVLKVIPCDFKIVAEAKAMLATIVNTIAVALSLIITAILIPIGIVQLLITFVIVTVFGIAFSYLQVYIDVARPNVKWKSIAQGIKNSPAILFSMLFSLLLCLAVGFCGFNLYTYALNSGSEIIMPLFYSGIILIGLVAVFLLRKLLLSNCEKFIAKLEA